MIGFKKEGDKTNRGPTRKNLSLSNSDINNTSAVDKKKEAVIKTSHYFSKTLSKKLFFDYNFYDMC